MRNAGRLSFYREVAEITRQEVRHIISVAHLLLSYNIIFSCLHLRGGLQTVLQVGDFLNYRDNINYFPMFIKGRADSR